MYPLYFFEENDQKINSAFPFNLGIGHLDSNIPSHGHDFLELHYVYEGNGKEIINGVVYDMKPGTFSIILPHQVHEMHILPGSNVTLYNLGISLKYFFDPNESNLSLNKLLMNIEWQAAPLYNLNGKASQKVHLILDEMYKEFNGETRWGHLLFKAKLVELLVFYDRYRQALPQKNGSTDIIGKKSDIWSIIHFVYNNYRKNISLNDLSSHFYLSVPYISTAFKKCLGVNFYTFLSKLRISNSCSLLTSSSMSIADIAYEVGYDSYSTFVRVFHNHKGMSPTNYRKLMSKSV